MPDYLNGDPVPEDFLGGKVRNMLLLPTHLDNLACSLIWAFGSRLMVANRHAHPSTR